jgi:hypothetical protein
MQEIWANDWKQRKKDIEKTEIDYYDIDVIRWVFWKTMHNEYWKYKNRVLPKISNLWKIIE